MPELHERTDHMPKTLPIDEAREMQKRSVNARKRNSIGIPDGEKLLSTRTRKQKAIALKDDSLTLAENLKRISRKMGLSERTIRRYLVGK